MEPTCQRCNETLREQDHYCSNCGMPQLVYVAAEGVLLSPASEGDGRETIHTGSLAAMGGGAASGIAWRPALQVALLLAVPAGLICVSGLGLFLMPAASAWAVTLYAKRIRTSSVSMSAGARIGLITGLLASWLSIGFQGTLFWMSRFLFHQGSLIDSFWSSAVLSFDQQQREAAQNGLSTPATIDNARHLREIITSPDGKAALIMLSLCMLVATLTLFGTIGGAVGARLMTQPRRPGT